ncbi:unnamed protein product, partial [Heterotrigona itama]
REAEILTRNLYTTENPEKWECFITPWFHISGKSFRLSRMIKPHVKKTLLSRRNRRYF